MTSLLERLVNLLERMDPELRGDRPEVFDSEYDAMLAEVRAALLQKDTR